MIIRAMPGFPTNTIIHFEVLSFAEGDTPEAIFIGIVRIDTSV
jgi:hypothetical protein